ncbi:MAG: phage portal protein [Lachnospiraceae bacterium]|nr:phage portal protein [Lachnospiraceae bacterium]
MGLFDLFRKRSEPQVVEPQISDLLLTALLNNETITREKAMQIPAVCGDVDFISNMIASMPIKLYRNKDDKVERINGDVRETFLNGDTADKLDAFQTKKAMVEDYLMGKGGYCYISKSRNDVTGLHYVEERHIEVWKSDDPIYKYYKLLVMGKEYRDFDFIKLLRNTKDGASGEGLTAQISKMLETAYQTMLYQLGMVKKGGNKRGFLKSTHTLDEGAIAKLKQAWAQMYSNESDKIVILNNGLEFQEASDTVTDMQLNESKITLQKEIHNLFHISDSFEDTFKFAIYPIVKAFETALNRDLLLEKEKGKKFFEFDTKEVVRANLKERYEAYKLAKDTGFLTLNEIRREENLNWIEGLDVVNVGLGAVLYDTIKHVYYTPNTDTIGNVGDADEETQELIKTDEGGSEWKSPSEPTA